MGVFSDDFNDNEDKRQFTRDKRLADSNPEKYCADRCLSTGSCEVYEDFFKMSAEQVVVFDRMMKNRVISLKDFMVLMMMMLLLLVEIYAHKGLLCLLCIGFCIFFVDRYLFLSMYEKQKCLKLSS